jgi:hypothetical protein
MITASILTAVTDKENKKSKKSVNVIINSHPKTAEQPTPEEQYT